MRHKIQVVLISTLVILLVPQLCWGMAKQPEQVEKQEEEAAVAPGELTLPKAEQVKQEVLTKAEATKAVGRDIQITTGQIRPRNPEEES